MDDILAEQQGLAEAFEVKFVLPCKALHSDFDDSLPCGLDVQFACTASHHFCRADLRKAVLHNGSNCYSDSDPVGHKHGFVEVRVVSRMP